MNKEKFLIKLYQFQRDNNGRPVRSGNLEAMLKINYRQAIMLSKYWEAIGAVQRLSIRGGISDYSVTSFGEQVAQDTLQKHKKRIRIMIGIIFTVGCMIMLFLQIRLHFGFYG